MCRSSEGTAGREAARGWSDQGSFLALSARFGNGRERERERSRDGRGVGGHSPHAKVLGGALHVPKRLNALHGIVLGERTVDERVVGRKRTPRREVRAGVIALRLRILLRNLALEVVRNVRKPRLDRVTKLCCVRACVCVRVAARALRRAVGMRVSESEGIRRWKERRAFVDERRRTTTPSQQLTTMAPAPPRQEGRQAGSREGGRRHARTMPLAQTRPQSAMRNATRLG